MYSERFGLPFITEVLVAAAERRRPGLGAWRPEVKAALRTVFETELAEVRARFFELFDDRPYWERLERVLLEDAFLRYTAVAEQQTALEAKGYGIWRGGDVVSRIALGLGGLLTGALIARAPFIPLPTSADLVVMATALGTPLLPDLQVWLHQRRFKKALRRIVRDMETAAEQHKLYQPLPNEFAVSPLPAVDAGATHQGEGVTDQRQRSRDRSHS